MRSAKRRLAWEGRSQDDTPTKIRAPARSFKGRQRGGRDIVTFRVLMDLGRVKVSSNEVECNREGGDEAEG